ncbi:hypothetical protein GCM10011385_07200 [Nitratireductor aestuarii]|uniref:Tir chaperone protein (CesT) family protein n=1 Tax=Nitratireductor aestuarii TaxID=1735103 RepID=A0A916RJG2_9HYPH|nr:type III secretion system chaperone [Nitratireductor aestuarii]GGA56184.1 hypothetical protein GCM10011385_07200 [Nitratireductor aestuarii]
MAEEHKLVEELIQSALPEAFAAKQVEKVEDAWKILIGDHLLTVEVEDRVQRICLSVQSMHDVGELTRDRLILLMQYSSLWRMTDGVYFALDENEQPIMMSYFNFVELNQPSVRSIIFNLLDKFSIWSDVINS